MGKAPPADPAGLHPRGVVLDVPPLADRTHHPREGSPVSDLAKSGLAPLTSHLPRPSCGRCKGPGRPGPAPQILERAGVAELADAARLECAEPILAGTPALGVRVSSPAPIEAQVPRLGRRWIDDGSLIFAITALLPLAGIRPSRPSGMRFRLSWHRPCVGLVGFCAHKRLSSGARVWSGSTGRLAAPDRRQPYRIQRSPRGSCCGSSCTQRAVA